MDTSERETLVVSLRPLRPGGMEEVLRLAGPAVIGLASQVLMNFTNTVMVAGVGPGAVGAVTGASMFFFALTSALGGVLSAIVPFASQAYGRRKEHEAARYAWQGIYVALACGLLGLLFLPLLGAFYRLLGHTQDVQQMEVAYSRYLCCAFVFFLLRWALQSFFQAIGRTKLIMVVSITTGALAVPLNGLLIFGLGPFPKMGVAGAGLATTVAAAAAALWFLAAFLFGAAAREHGTRTALAPSWSRVKNLARIGLPTSFQLSLEVVAWAIWHTTVVGRLGQEAFDANGAALMITEFAWLPAIGLGQAASSLVGWYLGRRQVELVRRSVRSSMIAAAIYMVAMALVMLVAGRQLIGFFFVLQGSAATAESLARVVALGVVAIRIAATFQIFDGWNITLMGALRGGGDTLWPAIAQQLLAWLVFMPLAWLLCFKLDLGMAGAWWACAAYLTLFCGVLYLRYRSAGWMKKDIFREQAEAEPPAA